MAETTVIVADDDPLVRELVTDLLAATPDLRAVGVAEDGLQAVALAGRLRPDVAVMDVRMPHGGGAAVRAVHDASPGTVVLAFSSHEHEASVLDMLRSGAQGYLLKGTPALDLAEAIRSAVRGETVLSGPAATTVVHQLRSLAGRVEDLIERTERLEIAKEEFIQILAHELLTPTTVMQASADTVGRFVGAGSPDVALLRQLADRTAAAALRLRRIVDNLTLAAHLRDDSWQPQLRPVPVAPVLRSVCEDVVADAERVTVHGDDSVEARTDRDLLARAVGLVLENAVDHGDHVELTVESDDGTVSVSVRDDGPGFPDDFTGVTAFGQSDSSTTRPHGGLGIGLYLTDLILRRMDGRVVTGAAPGGGAVVRLELPGRSEAV